MSDPRSILVVEWEAACRVRDRRRRRKVGFILACIIAIVIPLAGVLAAIEDFIWLG